MTTTKQIAQCLTEACSESVICNVLNSLVSLIADLDERLDQPGNQGSAGYLALRKTAESLVDSLEDEDEDDKFGTDQEKNKQVFND